MITQTIKVDLLNKIPSEKIIFRQGEVGREIVFEVYNDGIAVDLDGYDVTFVIYKPDGNFVIVSGTVDNDKVTVEETAQMTAVCGRGCFDLKLSKTGEAIYTYNGFVEIDAPIEAVTTINSISTVFGLVFPDDFQEKLTAGENITIIDNVISSTGGGGSTYTAGDYISILNNVIDVKSSLISTINGKADESDLDALETVVNGKANQSDLNALSSVVNGKQDELTAGENITIENNVISASGGGSSDNAHFNIDTYIQSDINISKNANNVCVFHLETTFTTSTASSGMVFPTPTSEQLPYLPLPNKHNLYMGVLMSNNQFVPVIADLYTYNNNSMMVSLYSLGGGVRGRYSGEQLTIDGVYMGNEVM